MSLFKKRQAYEVDISEAIDKWGDMVIRIAHRCMGNMHDAEDIFQTVFMRLLKSKSAIIDENHLKAWLIRITQNCCYDELRKHQSVIDINETDVVATDNLPTFTKSSLENAIDSLPPSMRSTVHLFYFEGYSTEEIATITGEKPSTVRSHLHRARKALKISLEGTEHE